MLVHDGMSQHDRYELCMRAENIILPKNGFFGLSAATGGLAGEFLFYFVVLLFYFVVVCCCILF